MAYNNTYNIKAIDSAEYEHIMDYRDSPGGLRDLIQPYRDLASESNPLKQGNNTTVNATCSDANIATAYVETPTPLLDAFTTTSRQSAWTPSHAISILDI
jgi:hypothetical protein